MPGIFIHRYVTRPCTWCQRDIDDPHSDYPSSKGTPDKDWLIVKVAELSDSLDNEVSFGTVPGATIPLCAACRDGLFDTLEPDVILDYRDGGSTPKLVSGREPPAGGKILR